MKLKVSTVDNGFVVDMKMSLEDVRANNLSDCFGLNRYQKYQVVRTGKFNNFLQNYLLAEMHEKEDFVLPSFQQPMYKIHSGDFDEFIEIQAFFPRMNNMEKPTLPEIDFEETPTYQPHQEKRVEEAYK